MQRPHLPRQAPRRIATLRTLAVAGLFMATLGLAACRDGGDVHDASASPAAAALTASSSALSADHVPPPPVLAVATSPAASASGGAADELATLHARLEATLVGAAACTADAECRTVATGAKACGGPTSYRAYSASKADPKAVADLAEHEHDLGMIQARASGQVSACFMLADPGAHCQKNKCVTGPAGTN